MRIIGDEHVSPRIVQSIRELAIARKPGWTMEAVNQSEYATNEDEDWVAAFARDGGNVILSADRQMLKRPTLISHIARTGLVGIYVRGGYANADRVRQAAHLLFWWPKIEAKIETAPAGSAWIVPNGFSERSDLVECRPYGKSITKRGASGP